MPCMLLFRKSVQVCPTPGIRASAAWTLQVIVAQVIIIYIFIDLTKQIWLKKSIMSCSVLSDVIHSSESASHETMVRTNCLSSLPISVMMSLQMEQVNTFLGVKSAADPRLTRRSSDRGKNFIFTDREVYIAWMIRFPYLKTWGKDKGNNVLLTYVAFGYGLSLCIVKWLAAQNVF